MKKILRISAFLSAFVLLLAILSGCSQGTTAEVPADFDSAAPSFGYETAASNSQAKMIPPQGPAVQAAGTDDVGKAVSPILPGNSGYLPNVSEKLIYTGSISVESKEFDKTVDAAKRLADLLGGYIESSNTNGETYYPKGSGLATVINRNAAITYRVPQAKFDSFFSAVGKLGNVVSSSMNVQNVTAQYVDTEARLSTLKVEEQRLLELLKKAAKIEDMITLESKLSDVRYQIESQTGSLRYLQTKVDYSTITLTIREVSDYSDNVPAVRTFWQRLADAFEQSGRGFVHGVQGVILAIVRNLIGLLLAAALIAVLLLYARRLIRRKRLPPSAEPEKKEQA
jgi:hypothetical protein